MPAKWTSSSHFVPARNSRHRTACLALYKALLAVAPKVPLPEDLATAFGTKRDPVTHHVRSAFRRNLADTSPRLVYPALEAGYRMLALLTRVAKTPASSTASSLSSSPERAAIESFLRDRLAERNATLAAKALHPPNSRNPLPPPRPRAKISPAPTRENPFPVPKYATPNRPLPQSELGSLAEKTGRGSRRQIPRLDMAGEFPFLRLTKPQPLLLSRVLHQKNKKRVERIAAWTKFKEEDMIDAQEEDDWERTLHAFLSVEEACLHDGAGAGAGDKATYEAAIREHGLQHLSDVLNQEREDSVARADAMRNLIKAEAALREQEEEARRVERRRWWEENQKKEEEEMQRQQEQKEEKAKKSKSKTSPSDSEAKPKRPRGRPRKSPVEDHI
ncbi:hypothetical protein PG996_011930 [Apiospora saccharicola]|uniref:DNA repair protein n=1 Tax=Apiospora saccharicola TaxID=335842 RepID=A0ABR1U148_9PEZI